METKNRYYITLEEYLLPYKDSKYAVRDRKYGDEIITRSDSLKELKSKVRNMNENNWQETKEVFAVKSWEAEVSQFPIRY